MNPESIIKREILLTVDKEVADRYKDEYKLKTEFDVERIKQSLYDGDVAYISQLWDELRECGFFLNNEYFEEFRCSGQATGLELQKSSQYSRYYECYEVARPITGSVDTWIAWTYWYGGGKYAEPEQIEWMEDTRLLQVKREMREVLTFSPLPE